MVPSLILQAQHGRSGLRGLGPRLATQHPLRGSWGQSPRKAPLCWGLTALLPLLPLLLLYLGLKKNIWNGGGPCVWEALEADGGGRGRGTYTETERKLGRAQDLSIGA